MKRFALVALVALIALAAPVAPAFADVTIKSTAAGKGMGMAGTSTTTTLHQGHQDADRHRDGRHDALP